MLTVVWLRHGADETLQSERCSFSCRVRAPSSGTTLKNKQSDFLCCLLIWFYLRLLALWKNGNIKKILKTPLSVLYYYYEYYHCCCCFWTVWSYTCMDIVCLKSRTRGKTYKLALARNPVCTASAVYVFKCCNVNMCHQINTNTKLYESLWWLWGWKTATKMRGKTVKPFKT